MHHKFIVIDFNTPNARVYLGSYNMSKAADGSNGENLVLIKDARVATSYMVEALSMIDHYQFRVAQKDATKRKARLQLKRPPAAGDKAGGQRTGPIRARSTIGCCSPEADRAVANSCSCFAWVASESAHMCVHCHDCCLISGH